MDAVKQFTCVAIGGRAVLIDGPPGSGKSSLALALIDRGAVLVGDDGVSLELIGGRLNASPPPNTAGLIEVRNVGLVRMATAARIPVVLIVRLDGEAPRFIEAAEMIEVGGAALPMVRLWPGTPVLALRAEMALTAYGIGSYG